METKKMTAVDWLDELIECGADLKIVKECIQRAKQMEKEQEFETKAYWFGRGVLAAREGRIEELKPNSEKKPISEWETGVDEEGGYYIDPEKGGRWRWQPPITEEEKNHNEFMRKLSEAMDRETEWVENREGLV